MKKAFWLFLLLGSLSISAKAQVEKLPVRPDYRLGVNLSQLSLGQLQFELERHMVGSRYSLLGQAFGGHIQAVNQSGDLGFNRSSHWGLGLGGRVYDKLLGSRLFAQMGGYYKETSVWYMQKQWISQVQDGVPVLRYGDVEVMDRYAGFSGELLAGAQGFAGRVVIEAAYGIVFRNLRPVGTFHGRDMRGSDEFFLHLGRLTPVFVGKIGYTF